MSNIEEFESPYYFAPDILKFENENGKKEQHIIVVLKKKNFQYSVISPMTSLLHCWGGLKAKSVMEYTRKFCDFLNYAYQKKRITCFKEITSTLVTEYLNELGKSHNRDYVKTTLRNLSQIFSYAALHYPRVCAFSRSEFDFSRKNMKEKVMWRTVAEKVVLPAKLKNLKKMNKLTNLDDEIVFQFLEIAKYKAPNCVFGFYLLFFGGLRASEVCQLMDTDIPSRINKKTSFYVNLEDKIINIDKKYTDLTQNKRNRKQTILVIPEIFEPIYNEYKKTRNGNNPVVVNRFGETMTERGFEERFTAVKKELIHQYELSPNIDAQMKAFELKTFQWNTHIGRGYYSNLILRHIDNPYVLSVMRGDSEFSSALPYIAESEQTAKKISDILNEMYLKNK